MFLVATKTAIVEGLRSVWFDNVKLTSNDAPYPRRITVEYPEEVEDWPCIIVQVRPTLVEWTGISPDIVVDAADQNPEIDYSTTVDPPKNAAPLYKSIRQGRFEADCMLQVLATESQTRDRIWDNLVSILLLGGKKNVTNPKAANNFYTTLENHDLVSITVIQGSLDVAGDSVQEGTPWDEELLTYESALQFKMIGTFFSDDYNEDLVPLKHAQIYNYVPLAGEEPPFEDDTSQDLFSAHITTSLNANAGPIVTLTLDAPIPERLINGEPVSFEGADWIVLDNTWLAKMGRENFSVLMVKLGEEHIIRANRSQLNTNPSTHKTGTLFKHQGGDWRDYV